MPVKWTKPKTQNAPKADKPKAAEAKGDKPAPKGKGKKEAK